MTTVRQWVAHLLAMVFDSFAALTGFFYSKKYAAIAKRLGLRPTQQAADRPGLLMIQIDGLAYTHLQQALEKGYLPNIKRMLRNDGYVATRWRSGLPSTTPASQAGIMFGDNNDIPAFRWYDKQRNASLVVKSPSVVAHLQQRVSRERPGIVTDGASYVNLFDGGAREGLFTVSNLEPHHLFENVRDLGFIALFLLNPLRTLHTIYLTLKEYVIDALQRLSTRLRGSSCPPFGSFSLLRIFANAIAREIETFAILVDIYRGVPAIYATYYGYDEAAHHAGFDSRSAHQALHDIDQRVGQINRLRRANLIRPYELVLLSDHGLTASIPFAQHGSPSLGQYITRQIGTSVRLVEHADGEQQSLVQNQLLLDELRAIEKNLRPAMARVARRIRLLVQRRLALPQNEMEWNSQRQYDVVVKSSGSLAHVYLNVSPQHLDLSEVAGVFPELVIKLLAQEGIWLVIARERGHTLVIGRDGILTLNRGHQCKLEGNNPLLRVEEPVEAAGQIDRIASFPSSGDLILFGDYDPAQERVICFENQWSSHGGLGGPQTYPFVLVPREWNWDLSGVHNSQDLYAFLASRRGFRTGAPPVPGSAASHTDQKPDL